MAKTTPWILEISILLQAAKLLGLFPLRKTKENTFEFKFLSSCTLTCSVISVVLTCFSIVINLDLLFGIAVGGVR